MAPAYWVVWVYSGRPLASTGASASEVEVVSVGGVGSAQAPVHAHYREGEQPPRTETRLGGGASYVPLARGLWDSGGRIRASESLSRLQSREAKRTAKPGERAGVGKGRCRKWASASVGCLSPLRPVWTVEDVLLDRPVLCRRAGETEAASPLKACASLVTPLTSPSPRSRLASTSPATPEPSLHPAGADP